MTSPDPAYSNTLGSKLAMANVIDRVTSQGPTYSTMGYSGGPTFINDGSGYKIAGITSWGTNPAQNYDVYNGLYGDLTYMTRVSRQISWINSVIASASPATYSYTASGYQVVSDPLTGNGRLEQSGSGRVLLTGNNSYSGGSLVTAGELEVGSDSALGSGRVTLEGGSLVIGAGVNIQNPITIGNASASVTRSVLAGSDLADAVDVTSDLGPDDTTAMLLSGTASGNGTLTASFRENSTATNDGLRESDVFSLTWNSGEGALMATYTLELFILTPLTNDSFVAWLDGTNTWVNAVNGNIGDSTPTFVAGAWNASYGLGTYGVDTEMNTVWAVLNHNSDFAVVPEPGTVTLVLVAFAAILACRRRATARNTSG